MKTILVICAVIGANLCVARLTNDIEWDTPEASYPPGPLLSRTVRALKTLESPIITDVGVWGAWDNCPEGEYVYAMSLKAQEPQGSGDDTGLNGIRLFCDKIGSFKGRNNITSSEGSFGNYKEERSCTDGPAIGFQMKSEKDQGVWRWDDNTGANNLRLICGREDIVEGDGTRWGDWTEAQNCGKKRAICGLATQIHERTPEIDEQIRINHHRMANFLAPDTTITEGYEDQHGLTNIKVRCCDVINPGTDCEPKDKWETLLVCDNRKDIRDLQCKYEKKVGVTTATKSTETTGNSKEVYAELGFELGGSIGPLKASVTGKLGHRDTTSYDWSTSSESSWTEETTTTVDITVGPGEKTTVMQPRVTCGYFSVGANYIKTFGLNATLPE